MSFSILVKAEYFEIDGIEDALYDNVELVLQSQSFDCEQDAQDNFTAADEFLQEKISQSLQPYGYFSPSIAIELSKATDECLQVVVDAGKPTLIDSIDIELLGEGKDKKVFLDIIDAIEFKKGDIIVDKYYQTLKSKLKVTALDLGYLDAKYQTSSIDIYPEKHQAKIDLAFDTGAAYQFGDIRFIQPTEIMDEDYLAKMIDLQSGDAVLSQSMVDARDALMDTSYFSQVFMELKMDEKQDHSVPLEIRIYPADRMNHTFKVGYSTDTGPRVGYNFDHYRINKFGDQISFESSLSESTKDFAFNLKRPSRKKPTKTAYNFGLGYQESESQGVENKTYKVGVNQERKVSEHWENINYLDLSYQTDEFEGQTKDFWLLVPGVSWVYTRADNLVRPRDGVRWRFNVQGATEHIISDATFIQLNIENNWIQSFGQNHRILTRAGMGQTWVDNSQDLPSSFRYFTGGDQTVRGYAFESIAPEVKGNETPGGINQMVASAEYEYSFSNSWAIASFYDVGSAYNGHFDLRHAAGFGLRWFSPIGPARLDFGFPLSDESNNDFRIHVTFGADF